MKDNGKEKLTGKLGKAFSSFNNSPFNKQKSNSNPLSKARKNNPPKSVQQNVKSPNQKEPNVAQKAISKMNGISDSISKIQDKIAGGFENPAKKLFQKYKMKIMLGVAGFLMVIIVAVAVVAAVFEPIQTLVDSVNTVIQDVADFNEKLGNLFTFRGFASDEETFYQALREKNEFYLTKDVKIDAPLIISTLFYNPNVTEFDYDKLRDDAIKLADAQVEIVKTEYFCKENIYNPKNDSYTIKTTSCGFSAITCICSLEDVEKKVTYGLVPEEEYKKWLKEEYITNELDNFEVTIPTDPIELEELINNTISDIYSMRDDYIEFAAENGIAPEGGYSAGVTFPAGSHGYNGELIYYNQKDYVAYPYGIFGNIKSHGCGPTSLSIVISSITGVRHDPIELTNWACNNGYCGRNGSSHALMTAAPTNYGLKSRGINYKNAQELVDALSSGNSLAIAIMGPGTFTSGGHFIVLSGVDGNGNVHVLDPFTKPFSKLWPLEKILSEVSKKSGSSFWIVNR